MHKLVVVSLMLVLAAQTQAAFKEVEWIKSPGSTHINTGYVPACTDTFEMKLSFSTVTNSQALWCSRESMNNGVCAKSMSAFLIKDNQKLRFDRNTDTLGVWTAESVADVVYTVVADYKECKAYVDDPKHPVVMENMSGATFKPCGFVYLFASYESNDYVTTVRNFGTYSLYRFTVRNEKGAIVRDFVPVRDEETGVFGLYEKMTGRFVAGVGGTLTGAEPATDAPTYAPRAPSDDVMSDAVIWLRGGEDLNGDGKIAAAGELNDLCAGRRGAVLKGNEEGTRFRTERVRYNYLNLTREESCIWLPQPVETNFVDNVDGTVTTNLTCHPNKITLPNVFADTPENYCRDYSLFLRFRPDRALLNSSTMHNWIVRIGLDWNNHRGLLFGLTGTDPNARYLTLYAGQQQWLLNKPEMTCPVGPDSWYEVLLSVTNGNSFAVTLCQTNGTLATYSWTLSAENENSAEFARTSALDIGTESDPGGPVTYTEHNEPTENNSMKAFRGSVNQLAVWNRALTTNEVRAVFAYPRPAVMRFGLENGRSSEFGDSAPAGTPASADSCQWTNAAPIVAAGRGYEVRFTLDEADATCPQILRIVSTSVSAPSVMRVFVNGQAIAERAKLASGGVARVFVPADLFVTGENVVRLVRTDTGAADVELDALELTGSWRIGVGNSSDQFSQEGWVPTDFYVTDGTWKHLTRAVTPAYKDKDAFRIHFTLPRGFAGLYDYRYDFAVCAGQTNMLFKITVNDTEVYRTPADRVQWLHNAVPYIRIPNGVLRDGEDNVIAFRSLEETPSGVWESFCRHRLSVYDPNRRGLFVTVR